MTRSPLAQSLRDLLRTDAAIRHALARGEVYDAADQLAKALTADGYADVPRAQVLEEAAAAIDGLRPLIPPSTSPDRRVKIIERSTLARAASSVRALAAQVPDQRS
jgi:hypothetical protein